jgi:UDP-glucose 4-epimerase
VRLIITGSSGQIGTNLALRCVERGHSVLGIDCRPSPWTDAFPCVLADLCVPFAAAQLPKTGEEWDRPDAIVHLAAHAKVHELVEQPERAFQNIAMTQNVLDFCRAVHAPIVFASSREVYGDADRVRTRESDARFDEVTSPYAASKASGETMVHAYAHAYRMPYLVFRLSNVYGRYDDDLARMQRVIPLFIARIARGEPVRVFGANKVIDFTYIDDCIGGILTGIERLHAGRLRDSTFNLSYGQGNSLLEAVELIGHAVRRDPIVIVEPKRAGEVTRYVADLGAARALLDFEPRVDLKEGIRRVVDSRFHSARVAQATPEISSFALRGSAWIAKSG